MDKLKYVRKVMVNVTETLKPYDVSARVQHLITEPCYCGLMVGLYHKDLRIGTLIIGDHDSSPNIQVLVMIGSPTVNPGAPVLSFNVSTNHVHDAFDEFTAKHIADWIGVDYD